MSKKRTLYAAYKFTGKDPAIALLKALTIEKLGDASNASIKQVEESGGPSRSTMRSWYYGKTKRPTNATIEAAGRALGMKRIWVRGN